MLALADQITGLSMHYDLAAKNFRPHPHDASCPYCRMGLAPMYRGYLQSCWWPTLEPFVLELTEGCSRELMRQRPLGQTFRGKFLHVWRKQGNKEKAMMGRIMDAKPTIPVPESFDIWPHLLSFWGLLDKRAKFAEENRKQLLATVGHVLGEVSLPVKGVIQ